jgi:hypothetical protein
MVAGVRPEYMNSWGDWNGDTVAQTCVLAEAEEEKPGRDGAVMGVDSLHI